MFKEIENALTEINSTNSNNEKMNILKKYDFLKKVLDYTYNQFRQYYITSETLKKWDSEAKKTDVIDLDNLKEEDIFILLDNLNSRNISGHLALSIMKRFVSNFKEHEDLIYNIIDRNLKIRMNSASINKVFKNLIPEFKVQLAENYEKDKDINFEKEDWYCSRKLDGVRCITIYKDGVLRFFSRTGNEFFVLDNVKKAIYNEIINTKFIEGDFVLDGEICIVDQNDNENFADIIKEIRKKNHTIKNPRYKIFDILTVEDFISKEGKEIFSKRYEKYKNIQSPSKILDPVEQIKIKDKEHLMEMLKYANEHGWEGLMIRKDVPYKGKRSKDLQKVKTFNDGDYKVLDVEFGKFRIIDQTTKLEIEEEMLSNVIIEHKGNKVSVGSGFSIDERRYYYKNPKEIIGKKICVKYFEETIDQNGNYSLRFPIFKAIYGVKREI